MCPRPFLNGYRCRKRLKSTVHFYRVISSAKLGLNRTLLEDNKMEHGMDFRQSVEQLCKTGLVTSPEKTALEVWCDWFSN